MSVLDRELLALMRRVSEEAILPLYRGLAEHQIEAKAPGDVVTVADRAAEAMLTEALAAFEPALPVVGEEAAHADPSVQDALAGDCWIVDPLDGTRNFARGEPPFGIIVARAEGGVARSGWIYDSLTGRFCAAHAGKGAFVDAERIAARGTGDTPPLAAISLIFMEEARRRASARPAGPP